MKNFYKAKAEELVIALEQDFPNHARGLELNLDSDNLPELVMSIDSQLSNIELPKNHDIRLHMKKWFKV